ncbi:MAG: protein translocase subunit SecD [Phycisphaerales bacterium]
MRILIRNLSITIAVLLLCAWSVYPPETKLRLGKDLAGGVSLVYSVQIKPGERDVIPRMIDVLKQRVDPDGLSEVSIVQQGRERIEITMPLPNERVKRLKKNYEDAVGEIGQNQFDAARFEQVMRLDAAARQAEVARLAQAYPARAEALNKAVAAYDAAGSARAVVRDQQARIKAAREATPPAPDLESLVQQLDPLVASAADAELAYDAARKSAVGTPLSPVDVRRAVSLSNQPRSLRDAKTGKVLRMASPREQALERIRSLHADSKPELDKVLAAWEDYAKERRQLDDPADLKRLLSGAGVLTFRITVDPGAHPEEDRLRRELRERGPKAVRSPDAHWYRVNRIENWYDSTDQLRQLIEDPAGLFRGQRLVGDVYDGEYFVLCWDTPGSRLTNAEGDWSVSGAFPGTDELGKPAINFQMSPTGAGLLGDLTQEHIGDPMAVLLDDQVYTAPRLQSRISRSGQITGQFDQQELNYIVRVLSAGSLQAKLSPEPISANNLGPELGADKLQKGINTGYWAFGVVSVFMIVYYFQCGGIAVFALWCNLLIILGVMALNRAAFTLPGIAGIVLTFGQAIDSNVLIYERMREEFRRGADMRTAVRLGFSKALASIVDGNVANLIICVVLYYVGTQEIKGFAITLGIGVVATLFSALIVSRLIFTILVDHVGWRRTSMLPMIWPGLQRALTPKWNWIRLRWPFVAFSTVLTIASIVAALSRGDKMLDTEFLGGTAVELSFEDPATGQPKLMARPAVQDMVKEIAADAKEGDPLLVFRDADVLPMDPRDDGITSDRFKIKTVFEPNEKAVLGALTTKFRDLIKSRPALAFVEHEQVDWRRAPVFKVLSASLGEDIGKPAVRDDATRYFGGAAILLDRIDPPVSKAALVERLDRIRGQQDYSDTLGRQREVRVIEGTDDNATAAVILIRDDTINALESEDRWETEVAAREWRLTRDALTQVTQLASVQTFSPTIAATFKAQAVVAILLSIILLTIYVWVRFGAARWALAATLPLFHDVVAIIGLIALAQFLYETPATHGFAHALGIMPFRIDLNMIAALLTIAGFSLNDTIIILDRIRENKGKLLYASSSAINNSINQTISRTLITSGTTLISTVILYVFGGEAVRGFAYAFTLGVFVGTYSSIAVSAPLVWSPKADASRSDKGSRHPPTVAASA